MARQLVKNSFARIPVLRKRLRGGRSRRGVRHGLLDSRQIGRAAPVARSLFRGWDAVPGYPLGAAENRVCRRPDASGLPGRRATDTQRVPGAGPPYSAVSPYGSLDVSMKLRHTHRSAS
jgi:hypothetical protein